MLGMLTAHLTAIEAFDWGRTSTWIDIVNGRSSILFATLAGVSIALVSGSEAPVGHGRLRAARGRLAVRAAMLWLIGIALIVTAVPVYVILPAYAILFLLALPLLSLRAGALWSIAGASAIVMPWLQPAIEALPVWRSAAGADLSLVLGWHYPFTVWFTFIVAGLAAGRSDLRRIRTQVALLGGGALAAIVAYGLDALPGMSRAVDSTVWTSEAHSSGLLEVIGSGGFALAVLGGCLLLCRTPASAWMLPIRAVGAMPLSAYVAQLVVWAVLASVLIGDVSDLSGFRAIEPLVPFIIGSVVGCTAWALLLGRGPLERMLSWVSRRVVHE